MYECFPRVYGHLLNLERLANLPDQRKQVRGLLVGVAVNAAVSTKSPVKIWALGCCCTAGGGPAEPELPSAPAPLLPGERAHLVGCGLAPDQPHDRQGDQGADVPLWEEGELSGGGGGRAA